MIRAPSALMLSALIFLCGCTSDHVLFVTNTDIGVGFDASTVKGHIGYSRQEVSVAPDYPSGGHLPLAASITSNLEFTAPKNKQFFATGDAALIAVNRIDGPPKASYGADRGKDLTDAQKCSLNLGCSWSAPEDRRTSVIATGTHIGLDISAQSGTLTALDFGFGRQEAALLPLARTPQGDVLPSALASIDLQAGQNGLDLSQFFATGATADALAANDTVHEAFGVISQAKAIEAAAAEKQKASQLATSLGMSQSEFDQRMSLGQANATKALTVTRAAVAKLLGRDPADADPLTDDDKTKIAAALATLPGVDAGAYVLPQDSAALPMKTAGDFRSWLKKDDRLEQALIQQQTH